MSVDFDTWLRAASRHLLAAGVTSARLDCLILMEDASGKDRSWLLAHPEYEVGDALLEELQQSLDRRARHEPMAYIRNRMEFYGRTFHVDERVLEPRPETETMIDMLKGLNLHSPHIIDIGTGSGAIAITASLELSDARVYATDIDTGCLEIARRNAEVLGAAVRFLQADLLAPAAEDTPSDLLPAGGNTPFVILANLPYVPDNFTINQAAMNEPRLAIFGGPDGLDLYRRMFDQIDRMERKPDYVLAESLPPQHAELASIIKRHGYVVEQAQDFIQLFKSSNE